MICSEYKTAVVGAHAHIYKAMIANVRCVVKMQEGTFVRPLGVFSMKSGDDAKSSGIEAPLGAHGSLAEPTGKDGFLWIQGNQSLDNTTSTIKYGFSYLHCAYKHLTAVFPV